MKPTPLILRRAAQRSLEGRSSARHPSFEAPLRCAPQDEVEENVRRCLIELLRRSTSHWKTWWIWSLIQLIQNKPFNCTRADMTAINRQVQGAVRSGQYCSINTKRAARRPLS